MVSESVRLCNLSWAHLEKVLFLPEADSVLSLFQSPDVHSIKMNITMFCNRAPLKKRTCKHLIYATEKES